MIVRVRGSEIEILMRPGRTRSSDERVVYYRYVHATYKSFVVLVDVEHVHRLYDRYREVFFSSAYALDRFSTYTCPFEYFHSAYGLRTGGCSVSLRDLIKRT